MKKVLAIVLTLAMLLSSMIVGLSAMRIVSENKDVKKYWNFPAGNSYNPVDVGNQGSDFDVEMDIRLDNAEKGLWGWGDLSTGPVFTAKGVGVGGAQADVQIAMSIDVDRWYHVKWDNVGGSTDIYVDGTKVGSVDKTITLYEGNQAFWNWQEISIDNLKVGSYFNDMEDKLNDGQGQSAVDEKVTYANENVSVVNNKYWNFPAGNSYNPVDVGNQGGDFDVEMDIRIDNAEKGLWGWGDLSTGPVFTTKGVGVGGAQGDVQIAMAIAADRWYHVKWDNVGGSTDIYVDGEKVGNVGKTITLYEGTQAFWNWQEISIDNLKVGSYSNDMEDKLNDGQGQSAVEEKVLAKYDLGEKYWNFPAGNSYNPVDVGNQGGDFDVEMDIRIDNAEKGLWGWGDLSTGPVFTAKGVGVGGAQGDVQIAMNIEADRWYHVKWDNVGGSTDIYVDDVKVGNVGKTITLYEGSQAFWNWQEISIDNLKVGSYSNDMEDKLNDGQGASVAYPAPKVDTIFDHFETKEVGGNAILLEQTPVFGATDVNTYIDSDSFENDGFRVNEGSFIMNFDLAVLPINDSAEGSCFEMWTNRDRNGTTLIRWKVGVMPTADGLKGFAGTESGSTKDFVTFDWGDATINNFKNVTYFIDFEHNVGEIYVDKTLVYTSKAGAKAWPNMIFMPHNATTVLDNIQLMDLDYNLNTNTTFKSSVARNIDLDAENFCEANGHINGKLKRTAEPKCYELGTDSIYCAVCGEVKANVDVAMTPHKWAHYDITRTTNDGLVKTYCTNDGCVQERYTTLPENGTYTGTLYEYYDMTDDMVLVIDNSWSSGTWAAQDGFLKFGKGTDEKPHENNYNIFYPTKNVRAENWSWNLDFVYNGTFDTVGGSVDYADGKAGYGHVLYFWFGGATTVAAQLGYNADHDKLFLVANNANPNTEHPFDDGAFPATTVDYKLVEGEEYNFQISMQTIRTDDHELFDLTLYVNGEAMIEADYEYIYDEETDEETVTGSQDYLDNIAYPSNQGELNYVVLRNFGIYIDVDDMAFGTADFAYTNRTYKGDLSGDYTLTAEDTLLMRKYLARVLGAEDILTSRADVNGDGAINAKDQLVMRKALMA